MQTRTRLILLLVALHLWAVPTFAQLPAQLDSIIKAYTDVAEFNGSVLIAQKGKILLEKGYGLADQKAGTLNTPATIYGIASITKTFLSELEVTNCDLQFSTALSRFCSGFQAIIS